MQILSLSINHLPIIDACANGSMKSAHNELKHLSRVQFSKLRSWEGVFLGLFLHKAVYAIQTIQGQFQPKTIHTRSITLWRYVHGLFDFTTTNVDGKSFQNSDRKFMQTTYVVRKNVDG